MRATLYAISVVLLTAVIAGAAQQAPAAGSQKPSPRVAGAKARVAAVATKATKETKKTLATPPATATQGTPALSSLILENPEAAAGAVRSRASKATRAESATAGAGVSEFQVMETNGKNTGVPSALTNSSKKGSALKRVHGELDGALAPSGTQASSAAAGAASKSAKTYIYLQADHAKVSAPR
ncbi:MAG: hypothetical protein ACRD3D_09910 [Terriglobia bacterium]